MELTIKKALLGVSVVAAAALLASCSAAAPGGGGSNGDKPADMPAEMTDITVAVNPSAQMAPIYYGIESGIFEDHNLNVEIIGSSDVAAIVSGIASGQYDFGFATVVHSLNANANGIQLRAVGVPDGQQATEEDPETGNALVAGPNSGIQDAGDLSGKTLGVIGLSSLNTLSAFKMAADAGVKDPANEIELVQLPFGQMPQALASGEIDAAVIQSPFIGQAVATGSTIVGKPNVEIFGDAAVGLLNTTQSYIDQHPDVVEAFTQALIESQEAAKENIEAAQDTLVDQLGITPEEARASTWGMEKPPYVNTKGFEICQELLLEYVKDNPPGLADLDVNTLVYKGALEP